MITCVIALAAAMNAYHASAQAKLVTISGVVTDEKGEPLPGASVVVDETKNGQITDIDG